MKEIEFTILLLSLVLILEGCISTSNVSDIDHQWEPFAVSFEKVENRRQVARDYNLLIVESDQYNKAEMDSLKTDSNTVIAYISLGEVDRNRWYFSLLEERGFLGVNENWDSPYLNLADSVTRSILLDKVVENIMTKGYDGLFLDTIDNVAPYTERAHLEPYMLQLIKEIRNRYPDAVIIQNAGLFLLDRTRHLIDGVLIEDIATLYDFENEEYNLRPEDDFEARIDTVEKYAALSDRPFLIVDYADTHELRSKVINRLEQLPYPFFISTIMLDDISIGYSSGKE